MGRRNEYKGEYKISKHKFLTAKHFALCYNEWLSEYNKLKSAAIAADFGEMYDGKGYETGDPQIKKSLEDRTELRRKMEIVEQTVMEADGELYKYLLKAVTNEGITYTHLQTLMDIPCGDQKYYRARRKFYYLLSKKI